MATAANFLQSLQSESCSFHSRNVALDTSRKRVDVDLKNLIPSQHSPNQLSSFTAAARTQART